MTFLWDAMDERGGHFLHVEAVFSETPNVLAHIGAWGGGELRRPSLSVSTRDVTDCNGNTPSKCSSWRGLGHVSQTTIR